MVATSRRRTRCSPRWATTTSPSSPGSLTRPWMRRVDWVGPDSMRPAGIIEFWVATARSTSIAVTPAARMASGSMRTLIWRLRPPIRRTWPTPLTDSSRSRTVVSATSVTSRTGACARTATSSTGAASGSTLPTCGVSASSGRSASTESMRSRTSWAATSPSFSRTNITCTSDMPSLETEVSVSMPLTVLTAASILSVTSLSTSSGAAPGSSVVMRTIGKSTSGNLSTPRRP